jgi:Tol biopolymer transport system component
MLPSFSDDGKRVAFIGADGLRPGRLVTAATEGASLDQFEVRSLPQGSGAQLHGAPPIWIRDTEGLKVAWVENEGGSYLVRYALDKAIVATPSTLLDCGSVFFGIEQFGVFRGAGGKTYIAFDAQLSDPDGGAPAQRAIFAVDFKEECSTRTLLYSDAPQSVSADFVLAPDGERMAHVANRATTGTGTDRNRIWIGAVSTRTRKVCSDPPVGAYDVGPQWISGGDQLVWTRRTDGAPDAFIMLADVAGDVCTNPRALTSTQPGEISHTAKNGCAASPAPARTPVSSLFAVAGVLVLGWRRRSATARRLRRS